MNPQQIIENELRLAILHKTPHSVIQIPQDRSEETEDYIYELEEEIKRLGGYPEIIIKLEYTKADDIMTDDPIPRQRQYNCGFVMDTTKPKNIMTVTKKRSLCANWPFIHSYPNEN